MATKCPDFSAVYHRPNIKFCFTGAELRALISELHNPVSGYVGCIVNGKFMDLKHKKLGAGMYQVWFERHDFDD